MLALGEKSILVTTDESKYILPVRHSESIRLHIIHFGRKFFLALCIDFTQPQRQWIPHCGSISAIFLPPNYSGPPAGFPHKNWWLVWELNQSVVILWVSQDQWLSLSKSPFNENQSKAQSKLHLFTRPTKTLGGSRGFQWYTQKSLQTNHESATQTVHLFILVCRFCPHWRNTRIEFLNERTRTYLHKSLAICLRRTL